jgi:hypothetical protein
MRGVALSFPAARAAPAGPRSTSRPTTGGLHRRRRAAIRCGRVLSLYRFSTQRRTGAGRGRGNGGRSTFEAAPRRVRGGVVQRERLPCAPPARVIPRSRRASKRNPCRRGPAPSHNRGRAVVLVGEHPVAAEFEHLPAESNLVSGAALHTTLHMIYIREHSFVRQRIGEARAPP